MIRKENSKDLDQWYFCITSTYIEKKDKNLKEITGSLIAEEWVNRLNRQVTKYKLIEVKEQIKKLKVNFLIFILKF